MESNLRDHIDRFIKNECECYIEHLSWDDATQTERAIAAVPKGKVYAQFVWPVRRSVVVTYAYNEEKIAPELGEFNLADSTVSAVEDVLSRSGFRLQSGRGVLKVEVWPVVSFSLPDNSVYLNLEVSMNLTATSTASQRKVAMEHVAGSIECLPGYRKSALERLIQELAGQGTTELVSKIFQATEQRYALFVFHKTVHEDLKHLKSFLGSRISIEYRVSVQEADYVEIEIFSSKKIGPLANALLCYFKKEDRCLLQKKKSGDVYVFSFECGGDGRSGGSI